MYIPGAFALAEERYFSGVLRGWKAGSPSKSITESCEVSRHMLQLWANVVDPWNPLFVSPAYAKSTCHGDIVAAPFFLDYFLRTHLYPLPPDPSLGVWRGGHDGGDMEWYCPIRPGTTLHVVSEPPSLSDITPGVGGAARVIAFVPRAALVDERGNTVARLSLRYRCAYSHCTDALDSLWTPPLARPPRRYSAEDWEAINAYESGERIRGPEPRLWDHVSVGDDLIPVIAGPTTTIDMVRIGGLDIMSLPPTRVLVKGITDNRRRDASGVVHLIAEDHYTNVCIEGGRPIQYQNFGRSLMARLITNYVGDSGRIRSMQWRNEHEAEKILMRRTGQRGVSVRSHALVGDTLIARGSIAAKQKESNFHLAEVIAWCEDLSGDVMQVASVIVELPSGRV